MLMPYTTTPTELQRNYRKVVKKAKKVKQPIVVLSNNEPELVLVDYDIFGLNTSSVQSGSRVSKTGMEALFGTWTKNEAFEFNKIVDEMNERIDPQDWK